MESAKNEGVSAGSLDSHTYSPLTDGTCTKQKPFSTHLSESTVLVDLPVLHFYSFVFGGPHSPSCPPQLGN